MNSIPHPYIELAVHSVSHFLIHHERLPCPARLSDDLKEKAGAFVSIKRNKALRGCIGTLHPQEPNLALEIIENAVKAATRDPRFSPVTPNEISELLFSIDVILPMEKVEDIKDLDPKSFGLMIKTDQKQGVLLPDLEGVASVRDQIKICRAKGRIKANEPQEMFRFQVHRFH